MEPCLAEVLQSGTEPWLRKSQEPRAALLSSPFCVNPFWIDDL